MRLEYYWSSIKNNKCGRTRDNRRTIEANNNITHLYRHLLLLYIVRHPNPLFICAKNVQSIIHEKMFRIKCRYNILWWVVIFADSKIGCNNSQFLDTNTVASRCHHLLIVQYL